MQTPALGISTHLCGVGIIVGPILEISRLRLSDLPKSTQVVTAEPGFGPWKVVTCANCSVHCRSYCWGLFLNLRQTFMVLTSPEYGFQYHWKPHWTDHLVMITTIGSAPTYFMLDTLYALSLNLSSIDDILDQIILFCEGLSVYCEMLIRIHGLCPLNALHPQVMTIKNVSRHYQCSLGAGRGWQNHSKSRTVALKEKPEVQRGEAVFPRSRGW